MKTPVFKTLTTAALVAVVFVFYKFNPEEYSFFPKCTFYQLTGWQCSGCGSQRAFYQLLHLNFKEAIHYNFLFVMGLPVLAVALAAEIFNLKELKKRIFTKKVLISGTIVVLLFGIARNLIPSTPTVSITPKELRKQLPKNLFY